MNEQGLERLQEYQEYIAAELAKIKAAGTLKAERALASPQGAQVQVQEDGGSKNLLNFCANNYLGLAADPRILQAAQQALKQWGYGLSSVRFICGTQKIHQQLEQQLAQFLEMDDAILYSSCFDANGGVFETLFGAEDAIISDELNHASIIDGIRLAKSKRYRYRNNDMADLERQLKQATADGARFRLIVTDGVFSMDGLVANLPAICQLAQQHGALVMVDDSHGVGVIGPRGRGTPDYHQVMGRVDILTGTFGKALGGASGGYVAAKGKIVSLLRQRSRPYLFSNSLAPSVVAASARALEIVEQSPELLLRLQENTTFFRQQMGSTGLEVVPGFHPIVPVMCGDAHRAAMMAQELVAAGIYVVAFSYPVVPLGKARIRVQISAAHRQEDLAMVVAQFRQLANKRMW